MIKPSNLSYTYYSIEKEQYCAERADLIEEMPVSLTVNGELWITLMCTPIHLEALAVGFLYNEGIITSKGDIQDVRVCAAGDNVDVWLNSTVEKPTDWRRTSGCTGGVTAVSAEIGRKYSFGSLDNAVTHNQIFDLIGQLLESQEIYRKSGGIHASGISDGYRILLVEEDIGRHNTLDKLAGRMLLEEIEINRRIVVTTGRISSEMIQKAARLGGEIVVSRTAPSSLSCKLAEQWNQTLIGYARRTSFRCYTHPERLILPPQATASAINQPAASQQMD